MQVSKVLVVDGDRAARDALITCLKFVGVDAHGAESAAAAQFWLEKGIADVLVLSDELGDSAPAALVKRNADVESIRPSVIVLTRGGALPASLVDYAIDDMLRRPIAVSRVVERVESLIHERSLRRSSVLRFGSLALDVANTRVRCAEREVTVGQTETRLLAFFIGNPDKVFSRSQLLLRLWPASVRVEERTVDVHIRRLRLGLELLGCAGYIQTVRGSGYRFSATA